MAQQQNAQFTLPANYYFHTTGKTPWKLATHDKLFHLLRDTPPEYITVLGFPSPYDPEREAEARYLGPWFADFDGDLDEVISQFQKMLRKLENVYHLNLEQVRLYATGGRGFHIEIPQAIFMPIVPTDGIQHLPQIYRGIAQEVFVDTMDMAIYSGKRGRMWRVPNRKRSNGNYKVPISLEEAFLITPGTYGQLCSNPRPWPRLQAPKLNTDLALLFSACQRKVEQATSHQFKASKIDGELQRRFGLNFPPCLRPLMEGMVQSPQGFNRVALQLSATAHALGLGEDEFIQQCAGLIRSHRSDGSRYNTPAKREAELRSQFRYMRNNNYAASAGGIRSILPKGFPTKDLIGLGAML